MAARIEPLLTVADLDACPDDSNRYELIEGELFVSRAPGISHQREFLFQAPARSSAITMPLFPTWRSFATNVGIKLSLVKSLQVLWILLSKYCRQAKKTGIVICS